jgi:hypothetical protein
MTVDSAVNGGQTTTFGSPEAGNEESCSPKAWQKALASAVFLYIFQLPAITGVGFIEIPLPFACQY